MTAARTATARTATVQTAKASTATRPSTTSSSSGTQMKSSRGMATPVGRTGLLRKTMVRLRKTIRLPLIR
jgi:hypothetical protein